MIIHAAALAIVMSAQVTPAELERSRMLKSMKDETRAGRLWLPEDGPKGIGSLGMSVGGRIREVDRAMTDVSADYYQWPHRLYGKVYDDLDPDGRARLRKLQLGRLETMEDYPDLAMIRKLNDPRFDPYKAKQRYQTRMRRRRK